MKIPTEGPFRCAETHILHCYTKITKYDHCTQNRIIHTMPTSLAYCFSNKEKKMMADLKKNMK